MRSRARRARHFDGSTPERVGPLFRGDAFPGNLTVFLLSARLARWWGEDHAIALETHTAYLVIFGVSSLMRLCTVPLLRQTSERPVEVVQPAVRVIAVRANEGPVEQPILSSLSEKVRRS